MSIFLILIHILFSFANEDSIRPIDTIKKYNQATKAISDLESFPTQTCQFHINKSLNLVKSINSCGPDIRSEDPPIRVNWIQSNSKCFKKDT